MVQGVKVTSGRLTRTSSLTRHLFLCPVVHPCQVSIEIMSSGAGQPEETLDLSESPLLLIHSLPSRGAWACWLSGQELSSAPPSRVL